MNTEQINLFHSNDIDITTKTIIIAGEIDDDLAIKTLKNLHILNQSSGKITIYLNSEGGSIASGRVIYDAIKSSSNFVRIIAMGDVMSCGTIILMAGDERCAMSNSLFMVHAGEEGIASQHPKNVEQWIKKNKLEAEFMYSIYTERINEKRKKDKKKYLTNQEISDMMTWDIFLSPKEALSLGLITEIGSII